MKVEKLCAWKISGWGLESCLRQREGSQCGQADEHYRKAMSLNDAELDEELLKQVKTVARTGRVTKCTGSIMFALSKQMSAKALRGRLQGELKEVRSLVGKDKEEEHFHPLLWAKLQSVIQLKGA